MDEIRRYVALIERNGGGEYFVHAPDLPGFNAGGETTMQEALSVAADVLRDWAELTIEAGGTIREPRSLDDLKADPELAEDFAGAELVTAIPLLPIAGRKARVKCRSTALFWPRSTSRRSA